jgi:hypothetical protein
METRLDYRYCNHKNKLNNPQLYSIFGGKLARYILLRLDMELWDLKAFHGCNGMITVEHILLKIRLK